MKKLFLFFALLAILSACSKNEPDRPAPRTVLVYIAAADNNLAPYAQNNLADMTEARKTARDNGNRLAVYFDDGNGAPRLIEITAKGQRIVRQYPDANSSTARQLSRVIGDVLRDFPSDSYALVLGSHGTGWVPQNYPLLSSSTWRANAHPPVRYFGEQPFDGGMSVIEIDDLAAALPDNTFDFILFDACYMGSVEVAYALRNKADYIINSPSMVLAQGFPYLKVTPELLSSAPVETLCRNICTEYYDHYNAQTGQMRSATISLVATSALDPLAEAVSGIVRGNPAVATLPLSGVQHYDTYSRPFMYDLDDFIRQVSTLVQYETFREALARTVLFEAHTPAFFDLPMERCCGLSAYIPVDAYAAYHAPYLATAWYRACYL